MIMHGQGLSVSGSDRQEVQCTRKVWITLTLHRGGVARLLRVPYEGAFAGIFIGRVLRDTLVRVPLLTCAVPGRGSSYGTAARPLRGMSERTCR